MKPLTKDNLYILFIRRFYDITGELDEYTLSQLNTFGNHMYMLTHSLLLINFLLIFFGMIDLSRELLLLLLLLPPYLQKKMAKHLGEMEKHDLKEA